MKGVRSLVLLGLLLWARPAGGQVVTCWPARPPAFDPDITVFTNFCFGCLQTNLVQKEKLLVFFPGTDAAPAAYLKILVAAGQLGMQSIGLMYPNAVSVNHLCSTSLLATCHEEIRLEAIDGIDRSPLVDIDRDNSIENRLLKFLQYLDAFVTQANWSAYLDGTNIVWSNIIVAGHSQGANMAGILAKQHEVARCLMFQGLDWWFYTNQPATWISDPGATPIERYFAFGHLQDPLATTSLIVQTWQAFGLDDFGAVELIDGLGPPYNGTHTFMTDLPPLNYASTNDYHNATIVDPFTPTNGAGGPVYDQLWKYMMAGPTVLPDLRWATMEDGSPAVVFETRAGHSYSVEVSEDLVTYLSNGPPVIGTGSIVTSPVSSATSPAHVRVMTLY
jgi:hypothetical protein